jgi:hypothetical protein
MIPIQLLIFSFFLNSLKLNDLRTAFKLWFANSRGRISCLCRSSFRALDFWSVQPIRDLITLKGVSWLRSSITKVFARFTQLAGSIVPIGELFIDIKPNFLDAPMNANKEQAMVYKKYTGLRCTRNKPKQTQPNPINRAMIIGFSACLYRQSNEQGIYVPKGAELFCL